MILTATNIFCDVDFALCVPFTQLFAKGHLDYEL